ncbi:MAG: hypothetical protein U1E42_14055 [Rhodospirillales bacterium]
MMAMSRRDEARYLDADERELVDSTRRDALHAIADGELEKLIRLVRERRARARGIGHRQRREMRGKAEPAGAAAARRNDGTTRKAEALAGAMKRLNNEKAKRMAAAAVPEQVRLARKALRMKRAAGRKWTIPESRTAGTGMRNIENERAEDLARPMEVGRVSQFVKDAQAKRDSRGG